MRGWGGDAEMGMRVHIRETGRRSQMEGGCRLRGKQGGR